MKLVLSNNKGQIFVHPSLKALGSSAGYFCRPDPKSWVPMPKGSTLFYMPGHLALGWDEAAGAMVGVKEFVGEEAFPVAAFPVPGFTRIFLPAAEKADPRVILPLWPYTALAWDRGKFYIAAVRIDPSSRQRPGHYQDAGAIEKNIRRALKEFPKNRLFGHLAHCARFYNCRNAQDLFLHRWEAPLPVSPACNAACLGCLSHQARECAASHHRIRFVPRPQEVAQVALAHIGRTRQALVSFGQGCEGEPLLQFKVVEEAIRFIRKKTGAGTIHMNTNGFSPRAISRLAEAGLDSVRISINSLGSDRYKAYYRPRHYGIKDVARSFAAAKKAGLFVSMNLLVFPGVTDTAQEAGRLVSFLKKGHVDLLQMRNLSIDPALFMAHAAAPRQKDILGIPDLVAIIQRECPRLRLGYFNLPKERFSVI